MYIYEYLNSIEKGEIVAPAAVKKQYERLIPILDGKDQKYIFDEKKSRRPIEFLERFCMQTKGEWANKKLELLLFQKAKYEAIFGIVSRETGFRKHREAFDLRARKNGKSTELGGISLYLMIADEENGAEIYAAASNLRQAKKVWQASADMIKQSTELQKVFKLNESKNEILAPAKFASYIPLSKNYQNFDGDNVHAAVLDELHVVERGMYDVIKQGTSSRPQPLITMITTRGLEESELFDDKYETARNVINGVDEDEALFALLYELEEGDDWQNPKVWQKANPGMGVIKLGMEDMYKTALTDKGFLPTFKTKDLNIPVGDGHSWIESHYIVNNNKTFERRKNCAAIGGFDLSIFNDLTAFTTLTYNPILDEIEADVMYWIPRARLEVNDCLSKIYRRWVDAGYIRVSGEDIVNYKDLTKYVLERVHNDGITYTWIYYDPYSAAYVVEEFLSMGFSEYSLIKCVQNYKTLSAPMQLLEADVKTKRINFNNNPVTKWCFTNASVKYDQMGNVMLDRRHNQRHRKIDGVSATLNAYVGLSQNMRTFFSL